jgi:hypothetical protein
MGANTENSINRKQCLIMEVLYSIVDSNRYVLSVVYAEENEPPANSYRIVPVNNECKPRFNEDFTALYDAATPEEQAAHEREQRRVRFFELTEYTDNELTEMPTSALLCDRYPDVVNEFKLVCPRVTDGESTGFIFRKTTDNAWRNSGKINAI